MIWEEAIKIAEECGYTSFEEKGEFAKQLLSDYFSRIKSGDHKDYLNSEEWKIKREKILQRDNNLCIDCKKIIDDIMFNGYAPIIEFNEFYMINTLIYLLKIFGGKDFYIKASEVHHLDYQYKQTSKEEEYCISLCNICHNIRHETVTYNYNRLNKQRLNNIIKVYFIQLNGLKEFYEREKEQHINELIKKGDKFGKL